MLFASRNLSCTEHRYMNQKDLFKRSTSVDPSTTKSSQTSVEQQKLPFKNLDFRQKSMNTNQKRHFL